MDELEASLAAFGRKQMELDLLNQEYDKLLMLLNEVINGKFEHNQIAVDLKTRSWLIKPNDEPETIKE